jgi:hypothetical protein
MVILTETKVASMDTIIHAMAMLMPLRKATLMW